MKELQISENDAGQRLDKFLMKALPQLPPSLRSKYFRLKRIKRNGKRCEGGDRLEKGDLLQLYINDEFFDAPPPEERWRRAPAQVDVVYEDGRVLLLCKPAGLVVHEDESDSPDTLIDRAKHYLYNKGDWDPAAEQSFAPALCNRIDRNTGGLVIIAKTAEALRILNEKIKQREISKYYLCLVHGRLTPAAGELSDFLRRDSERKQVFVAQSREEGAVTARLRYRTLETRGGLSLLECELLTGRTHQIRVQLASRGHALAGDGKYGALRQDAGLPFKHQALWSYRLRFDFPSDAGVLNDLRGREFCTAEPPFLELFRNLPVK